MDREDSRDSDIIDDDIKIRYTIPYKFYYGYSINNEVYTNANTNTDSQKKFRRKYFTK